MSDDDDSFNDDEYDDYSEDGDDTDLQDVKSKLTLQKRMQPFDSFNSSAIHALIQTEVQSVRKKKNKTKKFFPVLVQKICSIL